MAWIGATIPCARAREHGAKQIPKLSPARQSPGLIDCPSDIPRRTILMFDSRLWPTAAAGGRRPPAAADAARQAQRQSRGSPHFPAVPLRRPLKTGGSRSSWKFEEEKTSPPVGASTFLVWGVSVRPSARLLITARWCGFVRMRRTTGRASSHPDEPRFALAICGGESHPGTSS